MDIDQLTKVYLKIRDERARKTKEYEVEDAKLKDNMKQIETALLGFMLEHKEQSIRTNNGTAYMEEVITPTAADWGAIYSFIRDNDAFDMLEKRITKTFVKKYMVDNEGDVPPGTNVLRENVVRVRRS